MWSYISIPPYAFSVCIGTTLLCEIWIIDELCWLLGYDTKVTGDLSPTFGRIMLPVFSGWAKKSYQSTWNHIPKQGFQVLFYFYRCYIHSCNMSCAHSSFCLFTSKSSWCTLLSRQWMLCSRDSTLSLFPGKIQRKKNTKILTHWGQGF